MVLLFDVQRSMMWFLQMAQLSTTMSHAQSATAFHYPSVSSERVCLVRDANLLDLKALLAVGGLGVTVSSLLDDAARGIGHVDVGHGGMLETAGFGGRSGGARRVLRKRKTGSRGAGSMSC